MSKQAFIVVDVHNGWVDGYYLNAAEAETARMNRNQFNGGQWIVALVKEPRGGLPLIRPEATGGGTP